VTKSPEAVEAVKAVEAGVEEVAMPPRSKAVDVGETKFGKDMVNGGPNSTKVYECGREGK